MGMIEVKTYDLIGPALDWAVGKAQGLDVRSTEKSVWVRGPVPNRNVSDDFYYPSTDWSQGGPLIEKFQLSVSSPKSHVHRYGGPNAGWGESGCWGACTWTPGHDGRRDSQHHETSPLVAVCRTIVASVLGDVVQVPAELVEVKP